MPTVVLTIPEETKKELKEFVWVNWSEVSRETLLEKEEQRELFEVLVSKSKLSSKDAKVLADKINVGMLGELKKRFLGRL